MKSKVIAIMNLKGGVGKTTTAVNLSVGLSLLNLKVLVIDLDPQANTTLTFIDDDNQDMFLIDEPVDDDQSVSSLLKEADPDAKKYVMKTKFKNVDLIPSNLSLVNTERDLMLDNTINQLDVLNNALDNVMDQYDYIIIDTNPYWNILSNNVVMIADEVIMPLKVDRFAISGFKNTILNIKALKARNKRLRFKISVLFTMTQRNNYDTQMRDVLIPLMKDDLGINVYETTVRHQAAPVSEASQLSEPLVMNFKKTNKVAGEYREFVEEFRNGQR